MSIVKTILNSPVRFITNGPFTEAYVKYNNKDYYGMSCCHEEDTDLQSEKVGKNIAHYRALIRCMKEAWHKAQQEAKIKAQMCYEVEFNSKYTENANRAAHRAEYLRSSLRELEDQLNSYLNEHARMIAAIRYHRTQKEMDKTE